jgi:hypothetical protein
MLKRCYLLIICLLFSVSCSHHTAKEAPPVLKTSSSSSKQFRQVSSFNQVEVQGNINVSLHTGYKKSQVILTGDPVDLAQVRTVVNNNTLYVSIGKGYPDHGAVHVDIQTRVLNRFRFNGAGVITGTQLNTNYLDLYISNQETTTLGGSIGLHKLVAKGGGLIKISGVNGQNLQITMEDDPKIQMAGIINISALNVAGKGILTMYWVRSPILTISAEGSAKIYLAGVVGRLSVELWDFALFKGRYLRANRSFVKTHDKSVAEISAVNHQSNLASDASDIYYYNLPKTRADFMAYNGSVLDMREWDQLELKDFTRYNKQMP